MPFSKAVPEFSPVFIFSELESRSAVRAAIKSSPSPAFAIRGRLSAVALAFPVIPFSS